jgi:hypothetical protein
MLSTIKKGKKMTLEQAQELVNWLKTSYLASGADWDIDLAAETYDEMNDNTEFQDAVKLVRETA